MPAISIVSKYVDNLIITHLCIEGPFVVVSSIIILLHNNQVRSRTIERIRIAPFSAKVIRGSVVDIVIRVHYKAVRATVVRQGTD